MKQASLAIATAVALLAAHAARAQTPADQPAPPPAATPKPASAAQPSPAAPAPAAAKISPAPAAPTPKPASAAPPPATTPAPTAPTTTPAPTAPATTSKPEQAAATASHEPKKKPKKKPKKQEKKQETKQEKKSQKPSLPVRLTLHGYYRVRWDWINNVPREDPDHMPGGIIPGTNDLSFAYQRLRLQPSISYGPDEDAPIATLHTTIDGLDNVVFGDNAMLSGVPLLADSPSLTDINGNDLKNSLYLKEAWLELNVPVGQVQVGRMPNDWALGLLSHGGEGLAEWGDYLTESVVDRVLFATEPLTIYNAIAHGDQSETPLIFAFAYDRMVEDPVGKPPFTIDVGPITTTYEQRSKFPFQYLGNRSNEVNEAVFAFVWNQEHFGIRPSDKLTAGYYFVYRWQNSTGSKIFVDDLTWNVQRALGKNLPSWFTEGEFLNIQGRTKSALAPLPIKHAQIFALAARAGVTQPDKWKALLEVGFDSGDQSILQDSTLKVRAFHPNYKVGLLMYQVALRAVSERALGPLPGADALGANGSVWDSTYVWPQFRYKVLPWLELHGALLLGWVHKLNQVFGVPPTGRSCGGSDCFLGWEADGAARVRWGPGDLMWLDLEAGFMKPGNALTRTGSLPNPYGLSGAWGDSLWTVQSRLAMKF